MLEYQWGASDASFRTAQGQQQCKCAYACPAVSMQRKDADALEQQDVGRDESIRLMRLTPMALHKIMFTFPNLRNHKVLRKKSSETYFHAERASCKCECAARLQWLCMEHRWARSLCFAFVVGSDETEEKLSRDIHCMLLMTPAVFTLLMWRASGLC